MLSAGPVLVAVAVLVDLIVWGGENRLRDGAAVPVPLVCAVTVLVYATLLRRDRWPRAVFGLQWVFAVAVALLLPDYQPFTGLLIALWALTRRTDVAAERVAASSWALPSCLLPFGLHSLNVATRGDGDPLVTFVVALLLWASLVAIDWAWARMIRDNQRRAVRERETRAAEAVAVERLRLARELHDIISHSISVMLLQAAGARRCLATVPEGAGGGGEVDRALTQITDAGVEAMSELHRLLGLLRAPAADGGPEPSGLSGLTDLDRLVSRIRAAGVEVTVQAQGRPPAHLSRSVDHAAYRVVQEALTNTVRYAGCGASVTVDLTWDEDNLCIDVRDRAHRTSEPPGLSPGLHSAGLGLLGLGERVSLLGGTLEHGVIADGFAVCARMPVIP